MNNNHIEGPPSSEPLIECHYQRLSLGGRSNLYSLTIPDHFSTADPTQPLPKLSILAALSDGVYILQEENEEWKTICEPVDEGDEFISISSYYPKNDSEGSFIICYAKASLDKDIYSINFARLRVGRDKVYGKSCIEVVNRFSLPFDCAALKISHINIPKMGKSSFIVCSSFQKAYLFVQKEDVEFEFEQKCIETAFPQLKFLLEPSSNILALSILNEEGVTYIAAGCQDGTLICSMNYYNETENIFETKFVSKTIIYYPITSIVFFDDSGDKCLLVTSAVNFALVYNNLNFTSPALINVPFEGDSILSATLSDIDLDGTKEIVLGTYSQHIFIYKQGENMEYILRWQRKLPYPIFGIVDSDFDADGLKELVVLTMYGLHVLKPKLSLARRRILSYLCYIQNNFEIKRE